jgi:DNA-binding response OmpR family regulator
MAGQRSLLVVDDEPVVCESCVRVFEREGFRVDSSTDPKQGLVLASENDYAAVLLDIKMPDMDGVEFLERLRQARPELPVVMITGYASVASAAESMRLGAADYVPKPFTPKEISRAVLRLTGGAPDRSVTETASARLAGFLPPAAGTRFANGSWVRFEEAGARLGVFLPRSEVLACQSMVLPGLGESLRRDLPMVAFRLADGSISVYASPVAGRVIDVNPNATPSSWPWDDPCGAGWLLLVQPTQPSKDVVRTITRRLVLLSPSLHDLHVEDGALGRLGCRVYPVFDADAAVEALESFGCGVLLLDAPALGRSGPSVVGRVNQLFPDVRVVVLGSGEPRWEAEYRAQRIFYYAVSPFSDHEILDVLAAVYDQSTASLPRHLTSATPPRWISAVRITNRAGTRVTLLAGEELMVRDEGLGHEIVQLLRNGHHPIELGLGARPVAARTVLDELQRTDRLMVLLAAHGDALPGSLRARTRALESFEFLAEGEPVPEVTVLVVGPNPSASHPLLFDPVTSRALAMEVVSEMTGSSPP